MNVLSLKNTIWVVVLNLIIASGFYFDNVDSGYSVLASDVHSIVPIAQKFDNPELFKQDLFLNTLDNVKYYTPFFVQPLRFFAKITNHNYLQALNLFGFVAHFLFGILWFLLFYRFTPNFWLALILSVLIRGLVWLPGYEIWGITDLWSIMPRTIYITLMPLPFLLVSFTNKYKLFLSAFFIGLVFNFHPITGLGGIIIYLSLILLFYFFFKKKVKLSINKLPFILVFIVIGMMPFMITYFTKTEVAADYDVDLYKKALLKRIPPRFENPFLYLKEWVAFKTLFFIAPLALYIIVSLNNKLEFKKAKLLLIITFAILFLSSISVYVENFANSFFNLNLRMAFQFIRLQKLAILPSYFAIAFLLIRLKDKKYYLPIFFAIFFLVLTVSKSSVLSGTPIIGDDIFRSILPNSISLIKAEKENYNDMDRMMEYISNNTHQDDVFYGSPIIRSASKRSVVMDYKGASAIIEGNPKQFMQWYNDKAEYKKLDSELERTIFLKKKNVNYILTKRDRSKNVQLVHQVNEFKLYKIND